MRIDLDLTDLDKKVLDKMGISYSQIGNEIEIEEKDLDMMREVCESGCYEVGVKNFDKKENTSAFGKEHADSIFSDLIVNLFGSEKEAYTQVISWLKYEGLEMSEEELMPFIKGVDDEGNELPEEAVIEADTEEDIADALFEEYGVMPETWENAIEEEEGSFNVVGITWQQHEELSEEDKQVIYALFGRVACEETCYHVTEAADEQADEDEDESEDENETNDTMIEDEDNEELQNALDEGFANTLGKVASSALKSKIGKQMVAAAGTELAKTGVHAIRRAGEYARDKIGSLHDTYFDEEEGNEELVHLKGGLAAARRMNFRHTSPTTDVEEEGNEELANIKNALSAARRKNFRHGSSNYADEDCETPVHHKSKKSLVRESFLDAARSFFSKSTAVDFRKVVTEINNAVKTSSAKYRDGWDNGEWLADFAPDDVPVIHIEGITDFNECYLCEYAALYPSRDNRNKNIFEVSDESSCRFLFESPEQLGFVRKGNTLTATNVDLIMCDIQDEDEKNYVTASRVEISW